MTKEDLEKVKKAVIRRYPIAASLALEGVDIELSTRIPTACVVGERNKDGVLEVKKMEVNPEFFDLLTFSERVFVLAHECCHIALKHFKRATKKPDMDAEKKYQEYCEKESDPRKCELKKNLLYRKYHNIWNIATDACINAFLKKDGLAFPNNVVDPKTGEKMQFVDMEDGNFKSAEKIYDYLVQKDEEKQKEKEKEKQQQQNSNGQDGQGEPQEGQGNNQQQPSSSDSSSNSSSTSLDDVDIDDYQGIDSHDDWTGEEDENNKTDSNNQENSDNGQPQDSDEDDIDEEDIFNKELEERESKNKSKNQNDLKDAFAKLRGGLGMGNPMKIKPVISWKDLLVGTLEKTEEVWGNRRSSRFNPNARIEERTFEGMPEVEVIMDSSGSVSNTLLIGFLLQLYPLFESVYDEEETTIRVGCFGSKFTGFTTIRSKSDIEKYNPEATGGTDFEVAATSFSKDPGGQITKIVFTDGELGHSQRTRANDIIWIVFGNKMNFNPVGGRVIRVSDKEYDEIIETGKKVEEKKSGKHR